MLELLTSTAIGLIAYHHVGYPILLKGARKLTKPQQIPAIPGSSNLPMIDILVPAHNEASVIAQKIENLCALDYPSDKYRITIVCDGCTDITAEIARGFDLENLDVIETEVNIGKVAVLNQYIPKLTGEILGLSDASALLEQDALQRAAAWFSSANTGVVAATYKIENPGSAGEEAYWRYQTAIKQGEAALGAPLGVHGALYFIRRDLFQPLPADTINDDFIIPMSIVKKGYASIYDTEMIATELETSDMSLDSNRRKRIAAGNFQQLIRMPGLLNPKLGGVALAFASGKALRAIMPVLIAFVITSAALLSVDNTIWQFIFGSAILGILIALIRHKYPQVCASKLVDIGYYAALGHFNGAIGTLNYVLGLHRGAWRRANS